MAIKVEGNNGNLRDAAKAKSHDVVVVSSQTRQAVQDVVFGSVCELSSRIFAERYF